MSECKPARAQPLKESMQFRLLQQMAEDELAHSRMHYADLYDFSPVGYASLDQDCRIEDINITGGKLLGENSHKLVGRAFTDFIVPDDVQRFTSHISRTRNSWRKHRIELRLVTRQRGLIDVELHTMATHDADRSTLQFRTAILDITQRRRAEEALRQSHLELEAKVAERTAELTESHNLLQSIMDKAQDAIYARDLRGRYLMINKAGAAFFGCVPDEVIGRNDSELLSEDTVKDVIENDRRAIHFGCRLTYEALQAPLSGKGERWLQTTIGPIQDRNGKVVGVVGISRDITERRQREDAQRFLNDAGAVLAASLDYETTLWTLARAAIPDLADCAVVDILQDDMTIRRVAVSHVDSAKEQLLWKLEQYRADRWAAFGRAKVIRTGRPELYAQVTDSLLEAVAENQTHLKLLQDLEIKSLMCVPLIVRGKVVGSIGFMLSRRGRYYGSFDLLLAEDLADRAAIAIDNATLYSKEQDANRVKDEFLATVSHELRTPLTPIFGAIFKLRANRRTDGELMGILDLIERNARAQARIVEDLLDISRMTTERFEFRKQPRDLRPIVASALAVVRPAAEALEIRIDETLEDLPKFIVCDGDRIQQVVFNLLSNAMKFTPGGGRVELSLRDRGSVARIQVKDNGAGIHPDFLPHVFDRFSQESHFTTRLHGGLGLGLSIVRYIVDRHGGAVRAESAGEGKGAMFTVDLPYS